MFLHADLHKAVSARGGQRIEPRHGRSLGHDAEQIARRESAEALPDQPAPEAAPWQGETQDRGRGLHLGAVVAARDQRERLGRAASNGWWSSSSFDARSPRPSARPQRAKSCGDWRSTVSNGSRVTQPFASAAAATATRRTRRRPGSCGRRSRAPRAARAGGSVEPCQPVEKPFRRGRRVAVAIGRGEDENALGAGVADRIEGRHGCRMDRLAGRRQRLVQRRREAPGAAALAADEDDRLGAGCWLVAADPRPAPSSREPEDDAGPTHHRHAERHQPEHEPERARRPGRYAACRSSPRRAPMPSGRPRRAARRFPGRDSRCPGPSSA